MGTATSEGQQPAWTHTQLDIQRDASTNSLCAAFSPVRCHLPDGAAWSWSLAVPLHHLSLARFAPACRIQQQARLEAAALGSLCVSSHHTPSLIFFTSNIRLKLKHKHKGTCVQDKAQGTLSLPAQGFVKPSSHLCTQLNNGALSHRNLYCFLTALSIGFK